MVALSGAVSSARTLPPTCSLLLLLVATHCADTSDGGQEFGATPALRGGAEVGRFREPAQVLIFDAGSSGTRVHIFNVWPVGPGEKVPTLDLAAREKQTLKVKPGLSQLAKASDGDGIQENIEKLLAFADSFVPKARRLKTPALLKATAGLRAVPLAQAEFALAAVRRALAKSGYLFRDEWASVIPGREEAGLAWAAANYLAGSFSAAADGSPMVGGGTVGVVEMGGGSTQVVFHAEEGANVSQEDNFVFTTSAGERYQLYAHSYQGYGQDYAQARLQAVVDNDPLLTVDPCYPPGYQRVVAEMKVIIGTGDANLCADAIKSKILALGASSPVKATAGPGAYPGEVRLRRGKFLLTENFANVLKDMSLPMPANFATIVNSMAAACAGGGPGAAAGDPLSPRQCFALSYQVAFLRSLDVEAVRGVELQAVREVGGGGAVDWAVGAALVQAISGLEYPCTEAARAAASAAPEPSASSDMLLPLITFIFAAAVLRLFVRCFMRQRSIVDAKLG